MPVSEESGDRIPDNLTVVPIRLDADTVLLTCIVLGMQVYKYSPITGEITLAGCVGSISSSSHPVLGTLLHYSVFRNEIVDELEEIKRHAYALGQRHGTWANVVFGKFCERLYRYEYISSTALVDRKVGVLKARGWPQDSQNHKIRCAACFMVFSHVDFSKQFHPLFLAADVRISPRSSSAPID